MTTPHLAKYLKPTINCSSPCFYVMRKAMPHVFYYHMLLALKHRQKEDRELKAE